ncbi:DUF2804 domain-containing protein [Shewanella eurypsychrophilus]|uniref:DUF2804 domain-containing protein n=1 Tax=Shewanella eurypsychrophilus TaxID=2593656 RepID=A0ABX8S3A6_9GAMM|nr:MULTISPECIES: DUF2804 domain-containing protein [Shewanella]QFU23987.1 DUF2804 family protein [Shewanella sp. YLB-09]QXP44892.1 DUF2804 domain-containing protein [Shewanella eurypsychrophilus]
MGITQTRPGQIQTVAAPKEIIDSQGKPIFGYFDGPISSLALDKFNYLNEMDKPASSLKKYFDFKQFQFVSLVTPRFIIGVAIADIRYVGSAFCYLYDVSKNTITETSWLKPLGMGYQLTPSPMSGDAHIKSSKGSVQFKLVNGEWQLIISTATINAELTLDTLPLSLPISLCTPTGYSGWTYTQKHNGLKPKGSLTIHGEAQPLNQALAGYDFSAGFMRRETSWRWASINAHTPDGVMGLNLAAGVNETGGSENVFWINGERHLLGPVHFDFLRGGGNALDIEAAWRIYSYDGQVDLTFQPKNCRSEKLNLILLKSNFRQYIGEYSGHIIDNFGHKHKLDNVLGLTEDHFARW